MELSSW